MKPINKYLSTKVNKIEKNNLTDLDMLFNRFGCKILSKYKGQLNPFTDLVYSFSSSLFNMLKPLWYEENIDDIIADKILEKDSNLKLKFNMTIIGKNTSSYDLSFTDNKKNPWSWNNANTILQFAFIINKNSKSSSSIIVRYAYPENNEEIGIENLKYIIKFIEFNTHKL